MNTSRFSGVYAATLTAYDAQGHVDAGVVRTLTRYLINEGLTGTCPAGTTGEFPSLTRDEKSLIVQSACEAAGEDGAIFAGVWGASNEERCWLVREAEKHGAAAVIMTNPYFYPTPPEHLLAWYRSLQRQTRLPVFAYNIPQNTAHEIPLGVLDTLASEGVIQGYKDSSSDPRRLQEVVKLLKGRVAIFAGSETLFGQARELGVDGFISGVANAFPRTVAQVWQGDRTATQRLLAIKDVIRDAGGIPALKYLLQLRGFSVGVPREPVAPVTEAAKTDLNRLEREYGKGL